MGSGDHMIDTPALRWVEGLKMEARTHESVHSGIGRLPPGNDELQESIGASGKSTRIKALISAAVRVWELKRGIRE